MSFLATPTLWKNQLLWKMESLQQLAYNYVGFVCFFIEQMQDKEHSMRYWNAISKHMFPKLWKRSG